MRLIRNSTYLLVRRTLLYFLFMVINKPNSEDQRTLGIEAPRGGWRVPEERCNGGCITSARCFCPRVWHPTYGCRRHRSLCHGLPQQPTGLATRLASRHWRNPHEQIAAILPESRARDIHSFVGRRRFRRNTHKRRIRQSVPQQPMPVSQIRIDNRNSSGYRIFAQIPMAATPRSDAATARRKIQARCNRTLWVNVGVHDCGLLRQSSPESVQASVCVNHTDGTRIRTICRLQASGGMAALGIAREHENPVTRTARNRHQVALADNSWQTGRIERV